MTKKEIGAITKAKIAKATDYIVEHKKKFTRSWIEKRYRMSDFNAHKVIHEVKKRVNIQTISNPRKGKEAEYEVVGKFPNNG